MGFKKKFLKICCNIHDPTLLDGFPFYWVEKPEINKPKSLDDLAPPDREVCQLLSSLGVVFNTVELIKLEFSTKALKGYIGTFTISALYFLLVACCVDLVSYALLFLMQIWCSMQRRGKNWLNGPPNARLLLSMRVPLPL